MVSRLYSLLFLVLLPLGSLAQTVYEEDSMLRADIVLHKTEYRTQADAVVYWEEDEFIARRDLCDGIWSSTDDSFRADIKVYFTEYRSMASYDIFVVEHKMSAKILDDTLCSILNNNESK